MQTSTPKGATWLPMLDGPDPKRDLWEPWQVFGEPEAGGLTIGSVGHTEPLCRVSAYLRPAAYHARLICAVPQFLALTIAVAEHFKDTDAPLGEQAPAIIASIKATGAAS